MSIHLLYEPFNHIINESFFTKKEYDDAWDELMFLAPKMGIDTASAIGEGDIPLKRGTGIFLSSFYRDFKYSNIAKGTRKIQNGVYKKELSFGEHYFNSEGLYRFCNIDTILVQMYLNGDYYKPHQDDPFYTHVTALYKEPKKFIGGELFFPFFNYTVDLQSNQSIMFPSWIEHEVKQVKTNSESYEDARFTITNFIYHEKQK